MHFEVRSTQLMSSLFNIISIVYCNCCLQLLVWLWQNNSTWSVAYPISSYLIIRGSMTADESYCGTQNTSMGIEPRTLRLKTPPLDQQHFHWINFEKKTNLEPSQFMSQSIKNRISLCLFYFHEYSVGPVINQYSPPPPKRWTLSDGKSIDANIYCSAWLSYSLL